MKKQDWLVYILQCSNGAFYAGITNDLIKRLLLHNSGKGARYTRSFRPVELVWSEKAVSRSAALKREAEIRKLSRAGKEKLILSQ